MSEKNTGREPEKDKPEKRQKTVREILQKLHSQRYGKEKPEVLGTPPPEKEDPSPDKTLQKDEENKN